jgi:transposase
MRKHEFFIGVDVSKDKLDVSVLNAASSQPIYHRVYANTKAGISTIFKDLRKQTRTKGPEWLFCLEHTGVYGMPLTAALSELGIDYSLEPAAVIQRSMGLKRGKNDKADSHDIARYAKLHEPEIKLSKFPEKVLIRLKLLLSLRERLLSARTILSNGCKESEAFLDAATVKDIVKVSRSEMNHLTKKIDEVDALIQELIASDEELSRTYSLVTSVPGIGPQTASHLIVTTRNFTSFNNARQMACYAGIAPFEYSSGSSIRGRTRVSHLANKKLKSLFSLGALNAKRVDKELGIYYKRKVEEGKNAMSVMNAIRNKLISRVFATVKRGTPYVPLMQYHA